MRHTYTEVELRNACALSTSKRSVLLKLGIKGAGGNYATLQKQIRRFGIETSHFLGHGSNAGKVFGPKRSLSDYLSNQRGISSNSLRKRLITEGVFQYKCQGCKRLTWNSLPIPLELDHIDGDHANNQLDNLRLLCPNCHAQTPTYRGKNMKKKSPPSKTRTCKPPDS